MEGHAPSIPKPRHFQKEFSLNAVITVEISIQLIIDGLHFTFLTRFFVLRSFMLARVIFISLPFVLFFNFRHFDVGFDEWGSIVGTICCGLVVGSN